ncbi:hypothetical protein QR680_001093 [Steinernema hermaphroditum]|uniref:Major facilitator superfamily (MFS) profile domain-containing protein n=1 Tax=Steinernema hermaphroditum TaxID=289476 RepID=A0AA39LFB7_9BILA|nr:hypothetical protein QR680_001093 [Steinernema hermaphroditum]
MLKGTCCCCFSNSVRHLVLLLQFALLTSMFANILLFNVAVVYDDKLLESSHFSINRIDANVDVSGGRFKRQVDANSVNDDDVDFVGPTLGSPAVQEVRKNDNHIDIGSPVVPNEDEFSVTTAATPSTSPKFIGPTTPKLVFFTKQTPPTTTTTSTTTTTPYISSSWPDKEQEEAKEDVVEVRKKEIEEAPASPTEENVTISPYMGNFLPSHPLLALSQATTFAAPGLGMLLFFAPANYCLRRFGTQLTVTSFALVSAVATAVLPYLLGMGNIPIIIMRCIQGASFAAALPTIGATAAKWGSLKEQLFFLTFSILFFQVAPILSWPLSAALLGGNHVNLVYSLHAALTLILAFAFLIFYRNDPQQHKWVNGLEMNKIASGKIQNNRILEKSLCSLLFHSISSWSVWTAAVGHFFALTIVLMFAPVYLFTVLQVSRDRAPTVAIVPFVLMLISHFLSTVINKFCNCTSHTIKIRICNSIAFIGTATFFILLAVLPPSENFYSRSVSLLTFLLLPLGFSQAGFYQSSVIIGRYYSQFIVANLQAALGFAFAVGPFVVFFITSDNSTNQWRICFVIAAAVLIICNIVFCIFGSGRPSHWAEDSWNPFITHKTVDRHADRSTECGILEMRTISEFREARK